MALLSVWLSPLWCPRCQPVFSRPTCLDIAMLHNLAHCLPELLYSTSHITCDVSHAFCIATQILSQTSTSIKIQLSSIINLFLPFFYLLFYFFTFFLFIVFVRGKRTIKWITQPIFTVEIRWIFLFSEPSGGFSWMIKFFMSSAIERRVKNRTRTNTHTYTQTRNYDFACFTRRWSIIRDFMRELLSGVKWLCIYAWFRIIYFKLFNFVFSSFFYDFEHDDWINAIKTVPI